MSSNLENNFPMRMLAENFLNPSFGTMADVVHIVNTKYLIRFAAKAHGPDFTNAAGASGNLP
jgi:hypothetical protein